MPVEMKCPRCDFGGPLGFAEPVPWGMYFYHGRECPGMWLYNNKWYDTEAEAWTQYKKDHGPFNEHWERAMESRIIHKDEKAYQEHIAKWDEDMDRADREYAAMIRRR